VSEEGPKRLSRRRLLTVAGGAGAAALATQLPFARATPGPLRITGYPTAQTTANVISTAGDATLDVSDPGHLVNATFSLPQPLSVSGVPKTWNAPVSNDVVNLGFKQSIGANDALRSGSYTRVLTFTLSTTNP
jgi:hypothetical protein